MISLVNNKKLVGNEGFPGDFLLFSKEITNFPLISHYFLRKSLIFH